MMKTAQSRMRGAAVIAAMLVVAIAASLAAQVFERQQLSVRSIENRMDASQIRWIERAASDWARLVLRLDARTTSLDHLGEPWAMAIAQTELDPTVYGGARAGTKDAKAVLTGQIQDAQARFNLRNLIQADKLSAPDLQALRKLLAALGLDAGLGEVIAAYAMSPGFGRAADLLLVPGFDQATYQRLERYVIVLPQRSALNVNTASAELLHAYLPGLDVAAAQLLIKRREEQAFSNLDALKAKLSGADELPSERFTVFSRYFFMEGVIGYGRVNSRARILYDRNPQSGLEGEAVSVVWRESL
ncbi:MAG: general secretion pathway protein GspK [Betaproteobacteria bacterium]|nr:general secretion pathway protein GspK [Pseudomonadota bacterium]NCV26078.1 general secretion pathway protein GspK [Betaproteobacteria bacterium]NCV69964.1 general secretion pathway protein GspK [Betaproteobacteria bacterium]NCZ58905.1 general secretion pathway protein GspK [Betaproteobacteria bacterium]NDA04677.1 general secretion pathway protein GspK [Betaproteobacteria bacterium]